MQFRLTDRSGEPVPAGAVTAQFRHPAYESADREAGLEPDGEGGFAVQADLPDGQWIISVAAVVTALDQPYRVARRVTIRDGVIR